MSISRIHILVDLVDLNVTKWPSEKSIHDITLYSYDQLYKHIIHIHLNAEHNDTIRRATQFFRKIYLSLYLKGLCVRGSRRPNWTTTYWPPLLWPSAFLSVLLGCSTGGLGAQPLWDMFLNPASSLQLIWSPNWLIGGLRAPSAGCWLSLPQLVSNWSGLQTAQSYIIVQRHLLLVGVTNCTHSTLYGQGYTLLFLDRMHLLFIQVHFLFWLPGRVVGQYTKITKVDYPSNSRRCTCKKTWGIWLHKQREDGANIIRLRPS